MSIAVCLLCWLQAAMRRPENTDKVVSYKTPYSKARQLVVSKVNAMKAAQILVLHVYLLKNAVFIGIQVGCLNIECIAPQKIFFLLVLFSARRALFLRD
jgi:hypothetical protein